eukprot:3541839-Pleurochrysis_carterae.AAC.8
MDSTTGVASAHIHTQAASAPRSHLWKCSRPILPADARPGHPCFHVSHWLLRTLQWRACVTLSRLQLLHAYNTALWLLLHGNLLLYHAS